MYMYNTIVVVGDTVAWWLTPQTLDPEVGGLSPTQVALLCPYARHIYPSPPQKKKKNSGYTQEAVACPNMTEKLFTGMLSIKKTEKKSVYIHVHVFIYMYTCIYMYTPFSLYFAPKQ